MGLLTKNQEKVLKKRTLIIDLYEAEKLSHSGLRRGYKTAIAEKLGITNVYVGRVIKAYEQRINQ